MSAARHAHRVLSDFARRICGLIPRSGTNCQIELVLSLGGKVFLRLEMKKKTLKKFHSAGGNRRSGKRYRVREEIPVYTEQIVGRACEIWLKKRGLDIVRSE